MRCSLERELQISPGEELLASKEEAQEVGERPQIKEQRGGNVETSTQEEPSREVEKPIYVDAMVEEYKSIMKNNVWEVVPRPTGKSIVGSIWILKVKHTTNKSIENYKANFLAKGFSQFKGIHYEETFAPVSRYLSIRSIFALDAQMGWKIH
eukprot:PITA_35354